MIPVLFQNENFVLVDKAHGMLSVPSRLGRKDPRPVVGLELEAQLRKRVFPVHRLDFEVSGLMIFALTEKSHQAANSWFEKHQIQKIYLAATKPNSVGERFEYPQAESYVFQIGKIEVWKSLLLRGKKRSFESRGGDPAETHAFLLEQSFSANDFNIQEEPAVLQEASFWKLLPITGRSHQLRYELAKRKQPIVGDTLYGGVAVKQQSFIFLRSVGMLFPKEGENWGLANRNWPR